jgi:hypothetical protein
VTLNLSLPCTTFGFEIEPDEWDMFPVSTRFYNGSTLLGTVSQNINGDAGAMLAAATSTTPITRVVITVPAEANGFAMAKNPAESAISTLLDSLARNLTAPDAAASRRAS